MSKQTEQLELVITEARRTKSPDELLQYVIDLYGREFDKANIEIARLRKIEAAPQSLDAHSAMLVRVRNVLYKWAGRYAPSAHAKEHVRETCLLVQELDEWLLDK
jgi:hypothetical protein